MFETEFNPQNSFSAGLSFNYDAYDQHYRLENTTDNPLKAFEKEAVPGAYVQYTLNLNDKWMVTGTGLRGDYSNEHGFFVTPRAHLKYNPNEYVNFRLSAGKGYRTNHVLAENNYLLSSSRKGGNSKEPGYGRSMELRCQRLYLYPYIRQNAECECGILLYGFPGNK